MENENETNAGIVKQRTTALILRAVAVGLLLLAALLTLFVPFTQVGYGKYTEGKINSWESMTEAEQNEYLEGMTEEQKKEYLQSMYGTSFSFFEVLLDLPGEIQYMIDSAKYSSEKTTNPPEVPENGHGFTEAVNVYTEYMTLVNMEDLVTDGDLTVTSRASQDIALLMAMAVPMFITFLILIMAIVVTIKTICLFTNKKVVEKSKYMRIGLALLICYVYLYFLGIKIDNFPISVNIVFCVVCIIMEIAAFVLGILYNKKVKVLTEDVYKKAAQN